MDHKSIYISALEPHSGTLNIAIGFMEMLKGTYAKVAFFRPIISSQKERDNDIDFMLKHFELNMSYDQCCGFAVNDYIEAYGTDQESTLYEALIHKVNQLKQEYDFILIEGYPRTVFGFVFDFDINLEIAKNLDTAFIPILNARDKASESIMDELQIVSEAVSAEGCILLATIVNRCSPNVTKAITASLASNQSKEQIYLFPEVKELDTPTLAQVIKTLDAQMLLGNETQLQHLVHGKKIAAMGVENYLSHIENGDIVIVSGDRVDIILASILSFYAKNHSNIVALILSGGMTLSKPIMALLQDFSTLVIPIFSVQTDSYQTAIAIEKIAAK